jgi:glycosyltransferase involved in cell wall biosynthesis
LLILTPSHGIYGGVERIIENLDRGLTAAGFRVLVGLARGAHFHNPDAYRRAYPQLTTVEIDGLGGTRAGRLGGLARTLDAARPDVVLVSRLFDAYEAVAALKLAGDPLRLAVTIDGYECEYVADLGLFEEFVDLCVTSGQLLAMAVQRFSQLPSERILSIPGGVRPPRRFVTHEDSRPLRLGYVGRLDQGVKRVMDLPEMLQRLDTLGVSYTCLVVGAGPAEAELREAIESRAFAGRVKLRSWSTLEQLYEQVYPELDVVFVFSVSEGATIAPREAMAHGVVPVVSRFLGCRSGGQFREGVNALVFEVGSVDQAAACVRRLHQDRALLRRLSAAARLSQEGPNSEVGAVNAWAGALRDVLRRPARVGQALPTLAWPKSGRLERWGLSPLRAEVVRRLLGRAAEHSEPGGEWPHTSGLIESARLDEIAAFAEACERAIGRPRHA